MKKLFILALTLISIAQAVNAAEAPPGKIRGITTAQARSGGRVPGQASG